MGNSDDLRLFEITLARDASFGAVRDPTGAAWVSATSEEEARRIVRAQLGEVAIAGVEEYRLGPPRLIAFSPPS